MGGDKDLIICRCEEVLKEDILKAYRAGAQTVDAVKRRTRAGMGLCQGRTCRRLVSAILAKEKGQSLSEENPPTFRFPVRPIGMNLFEW